MAHPLSSRCFLMTDTPFMLRSDLCDEELLLSVEDRLKITTLCSHRSYNILGMVPPRGWRRNSNIVADTLNSEELCLSDPLAKLTLFSAEHLSPLAQLRHLFQCFHGCSLQHQVFPFRRHLHRGEQHRRVHPLLPEKGLSTGQFVIELYWGGGYTPLVSGMKK